MSTTTSTRKLTLDFIETIWNQQHIERIDEFIHPDFTDHSLSPTMPPTKDGLLRWIQATSQSFIHQTLIDDQVTEAGKSMLKIRMVMKHIGEWRTIPATGAEVSAAGYRFFRLADGKIIEHWALIDGNALENQLKQVVASGYKIAN